MKKYFFIIILLVYSFLWSTELVTLSGTATQGGILLGTVNKNIEKVFLNYENIPIHKHKFIIGFDRDEKLRQILTITLKNGEIYNILFYISKREYKTQKINKMASEYVEKPKEKNLIQKIDNEANSIRAAKNAICENEDKYFKTFIRPITGGRESSPFGCQRIINGISMNPHNGLDIAVPTGTSIKSMASGIVVLTGDFFYNGKFVLLDHGLGLSSVYLHMSKINVKVGQKVSKRKIIGEVGSSGRSTGAHLHWGVGWNKKRIDPELILKTDDLFLSFKTLKEIK
jgi:murein DD-endopeptidase MepM/ murein hydrolase activator NlpD